MRYLSIILSILACLYLPQWIVAQDDSSSSPIILVHGFCGWGPDELLGYRYWGGTVLDVESYLRENGFAVYTSSVGPISSNHDRACELFYQIKGGNVDYGASHCQKYHHNRFGRTYSGCYPQWDGSHPVHLIGHSMGGQTARVLLQLLAQDFFGMGTDETWIKSITTLSSPHNGTTLATNINEFAGGYAEQLIAGFLALAGTNWELYDFDMDHWNLKPQPGETLHDFLVRIDRTIGENKEDLSMQDLLPSGAQKINQQVSTFPNVYYFSYATEETYVLDPEPGHEWAEPEMNPMFWVFAYYIGHYEGPEISPNKDWWKNDGVANTISMAGPANAQIIKYSGVSHRGVWNYMGLIESKDHGKILGHYQGPISGDWLYKFYLDLASMLHRLP